MAHSLADYNLVSEPIQGGNIVIPKRLLRTAEEKRRIVEATLVPGASIARVARENGVNANQVFQWRYEYKNSVGWATKRPQTRFLPVTVAAEPSSVIMPEDASTLAPTPTSASIH